MDDDEAILDLDRAIADAATLLLRLEKYHRGRGADVLTLRRAVTGIGARARRSLRRDGVDGGAAATLAREAALLARDLHAILREVLTSPPYREAVRLYQAGDGVSLQPHLLAIFDGLVRAPLPTRLYAPVPWSGRRGPRPPEELVATLDEIRREGLIASGDELEPGVDPELPAVVLSPAWPDGAPVALCCAEAQLAPPHLIGSTGEVLLHRPSVHLDFEVGLQLDRAAVDEWVEDLAAYETGLRAVLEPRGFVIREVPTPAAP